MLTVFEIRQESLSLFFVFNLLATLNVSPKTMLNSKNTNEKVRTKYRKASQFYHKFWYNKKLFTRFNISLKKEKFSSEIVEKNKISMFNQYYWLPRQQYVPKCHKLQSMYLLIEKKFPDYVRKKVSVRQLWGSQKRTSPCGLLNLCALLLC